MAETPIKLVTAPDAREQHRKDILDALDNLRRDVEAGNVEHLMVIIARTDGLWKWNEAGETGITGMIGRMEIVKGELVNSYIENERKAPPSEGA